jgi:hypothetical protein
MTIAAPHHPRRQSWYGPCARYLPETLDASSATSRTFLLLEYLFASSLTCSQYFKCFKINAI